MSDEAYRKLFGDTPEEVASLATEVIWLPEDRLTAALIGGLIGLDPGRVEKLGRAGHLPRGADGLYPVADALDAWASYSRAAVGASARTDLGLRGAEGRWKGDKRKRVLSCLQDAFRETVEGPEGLKPFQGKPKKSLAGAISDRLKINLKDSGIKPLSERTILRYLPRLLSGEELV